MSNDQLAWLQEWYVSQCDGDWEHQCGVKIDTLDNPGWSLRIDLVGTTLEDLEFPALWHEADEHTWWSCKVEGKQFVAACGPRNLSDVIRVFREWQSEAGGELQP